MRFAAYKSKICASAEQIYDLYHLLLLARRAQHHLMTYLPVEVGHGLCDLYLY